MNKSGYRRPYCFYKLLLWSLSVFCNVVVAQHSPCERKTADCLLVGPGLCNATALHASHFQIRILLRAVELIEVRIISSVVLVRAETLALGSRSWNVTFVAPFPGEYSVRVDAISRGGGKKARQHRALVLPPFAVTFLASDGAPQPLPFCEHLHLHEPIRYGMWTKADNCSTGLCEGDLGWLSSGGWVWVPLMPRCRYRIYGQRELWACLRGAHVVFVGDSTTKETVADVMLLLLGLDSRSYPQLYNLLWWPKTMMSKARAKREQTKVCVMHARLPCTNTHHSA